ISSNPSPNRALGECALFFRRTLSSLHAPGVLSENRSRERQTGRCRLLARVDIADGVYGIGMTIRRRELRPACARPVTSRFMGPKSSARRGCKKGGLLVV